MSRYSLHHLSDHVVLRDLAIMVARERESTADLLAHIAEVSARKLHLKAAYHSMTAYCIAKLHLSEGAAAKRVRAAHVARRFPVIFEMVADGRLHLSAVVALARYLRKSNVEELLAAAVHRTRAEIEAYLAQKFPRTDLLALVTTIPARGATAEALAPGLAETAEATAASVMPGPFGDQVGSGVSASGRAGPEATQPSASPPSLPALARSPEAPGPAHTVSGVTTLSTQTYAVQFTMSRHGHDLLRQARELLGHEIPSGDIAEVFEKVLKLAVAQLEKRKFAATSKPRRATTAELEPTLHPGRGKAGRARSRWRSVHVRERRRQALRGPVAARVRSRHRSRAGRRGDGGWDPASLPCSQSVHRRAHVRRRVHA